MVLRSPRLVGRDQERELLARSADAARSGAGTAIAVIGEAGVGKSRLVTEMLVGSRAEGMLALRGRTGAAPGRIPFRPVAEALAGGLRERPNLQLDLRGFRPALASVLPGWFDGPGASSPDVVFVAEAVLRLLRLLASDRGAVMVLEDLQEADSESLDLVSYLVDNIAGERLLLVLTVREPPESRALHALRERAGAGALRWLQLARMAERDLEAIAESCLGEPLPFGLWEVLRTRSEGLPLFVEELLSAIPDDLLAQVRDQDVLAWRIAVHVPTSFQTAVDEQLAALGEVGRRVIGTAGLLGRSFDTTLLQPATGCSIAEVGEALRTATSAGLVLRGREAERDWLTFRHELTRDSVLAGTPPPVRRSLAAGALTALMAAQPDLGGGWCEIGANLALAAGKPGLAVSLMRRLATRAAAEGAVGVALQALERAAVVSPPAAEPLRTVQLELLEARVAAGHLELAEALGTRLLPELEPGSEAADRAHLALADVGLTRLDFESVARHLGAITGATGELKARRDLSRARLELARYRYSTAERLARAVATSLDANSAEIKCEALLMAGHTLAARDPGAAEVLFLEALEAAGQEGLAVARAFSLAALAGLDVLRVVSPERVLAARRAALDCGLAGLAAALTHDLAMLSLLRFDLEEARRWAAACIADGRRFGLGWVLAAGLIKEAFAAALEGRGAEAGRLLDEAEPLVAGDPRGTALMSGHVRAVLAINAEDLEAATSVTSEAAALWWRHRLEPRPFLGLWVLLQALRGADAYRSAVGRLEHRRALWQPTTRGLALAGRGILLTEAGRQTEAEQLVAQALPLLEGTPWFHGVACRVVGERLLPSGGTSGEALLHTALAFFSASGLEVPASRCRLLLRAAGRRVPRRGRGHASVPAAFAALGISSREMDVLELLATGLTNRQIGERLFLSSRTVDKHVQRLLGKTGSANRTALADRLHQLPEGAHA